MQYTLTQVDIDANPLLSTLGLKDGSVITYTEPEVDEAATAEAPAEAPAEEEVAS